MSIRDMVITLRDSITSLERITESLEDEETINDIEMVIEMLQDCFCVGDIAEELENIIEVLQEVI